MKKIFTLLLIAVLTLSLLAGCSNTNTGGSVAVPADLCAVTGSSEHHLGTAVHQTQLSD